jgi:hypothetical protein
MVFVFGFDVPVIEILLVSTVVILITLVFLAYYIKKILFSLEQLEKHLGIHAFQQMPGERARVRLEAYIKYLQGEGKTETQIRQDLLKLGWESMVVNAVLWKLKEEERGHDISHQPHKVRRFRE